MIDFSKLTDSEIVEHLELLKQIEIDDRWAALNDYDSPKRNPNYRFIMKSYYDQKFEDEKLVSGYKGVVLEGSARSGKTYSALQAICQICKRSKQSLVVNIIKETYNEFKTTLYKDFRAILEDLGLDNPFARMKEVDQFKIGNSYIYFIGADNPNKIHGNSADIIYFNEALPIEETVFSQSIMRCSRFWIVDYNPSVTEHYIYKSVIPRPDVGFLRTTLRDNPYIPLPQKLEILATEPFESGSYEIVGEKELWYNGKPIDETNQPPPHPINVDAGTADLFKWSVYGLGLRGAMKGVIFRNVKYIDREQLPADLEGCHSYGLDFGFTSDPTVLTRCWHRGKEIYVEVLSYEPYDNPQYIIDLFDARGVEDYLPIACDSADRYVNGDSCVRMIVSLQDAGYQCFGVNKAKGNMFWITLMKSNTIFFIKNEYLKQIMVETENYKFKQINDISINQPIDKHNHIWDSVRYNYMSYMNSNSIEADWY